MNMTYKENGYQLGSATNSLSQTSVILPLYKHDHQELPQRSNKINTLNSLGAQIVVGLNGSSATQHDITSFLPANSTIFESKEPLSMSEHWSELKNLATGKYIRYWFSGDEIDVNCLVEHVEQLRAREEVSIVFSPRIIRLGSTSLPPWLSSQKRVFGPSSKEYKDVEVLESVLVAGTNPVGEPSFVTFRKSKMPNCWPTDRGYVVDLAMYRDCLKAGNALWLPNAIAGSFGVSEKSGSFEMAKQQSSDFKSLVSEWKGLPLSRWENYRIKLRSALRRIIYFVFFRRVIK
jgi:hypothetical protein